MSQSDLYTGDLDYDYNFTYIGNSELVSNGLLINLLQQIQNCLSGTAVEAPKFSHVAYPSSDP